MIFSVLQSQNAIKIYIISLSCLIRYQRARQPNKGRILYGRATYHRDVRLYAIGGTMAAYLQCQFLITKEQFQDFTVEDWCDNSKWSDTKLLVDSSGGDLYERDEK